MRWQALLLIACLLSPGLTGCLEAEQQDPDQPSPAPEPEATSQDGLHGARFWINGTLASLTDPPPIEITTGADNQTRLSLISSQAMTLLSCRTQEAGDVDCQPAPGPGWGSAHPEEGMPVCAIVSLANGTLVAHKVHLGARCGLVADPATVPAPILPTAGDGSYAIAWVRGFESGDPAGEACEPPADHAVRTDGEALFYNASRYDIDATGLSRMIAVTRWAHGNCPVDDRLVVDEGTVRTRLHPSGNASETIAGGPSSLKVSLAANGVVTVEAGDQTRELQPGEVWSMGYNRTTESADGSGRTFIQGTVYVHALGVWRTSGVHSVDELPLEDLPYWRTSDETYTMIRVQGQEEVDPPPDQTVACSVPWDHSVFPKEQRVSYNDRTYDVEPSKVVQLVSVNHVRVGECGGFSQLYPDQNRISAELGAYGRFNLTVAPNGTVDVDGRAWLVPGENVTLTYTAREIGEDGGGEAGRRADHGDPPQAVA